jgi:hypothetical protein
VLLGLSNPIPLLNGRGVEFARTPDAGIVIPDEKWPVARLIPISSASGIEAQQGRLASALLAVMATVPEFGFALLNPPGAPSGKFEKFIEVLRRRASVGDGRAGCYPTFDRAGTRAEAGRAVEEDGQA